MKKYLLSSLLGAVLMFFTLVMIASLDNRKNAEEYEHIDYVSTITPEDCFICGEQGAYWDQDNVGIVNLNTFELLYLPIIRYNDQKEPIKEPTGVMQHIGMTDSEAVSYVHAEIFPDNAFATVEISGVQHAIDRDSIQSHLCQSCLDSINSMWFLTQPPAELAVISFEDRTIQPILSTRPWFSAGNYGIDCAFKTNGEMDLLIHYAVNPYLVS